MLTPPFYCIDYAPSGRQRYVTTSNHSRGPFYYDNLFSFPLDYYEGVCDDYITDELEQRRAERLFYGDHREHMNRDRDREDLLMLERIRQAEIQERERLLDEERRAAAAAAAAASVERERRLQRLIHEKRRQEKETAARRRRHMNMLLKKSQPSYRTIRHDPDTATLFFNPMITTKIPIYEEMTGRTTEKEMPYQSANPSSCQQAIPISMSMSSAPNIRCDAKTSSTPSIHAKAVMAQKKKNPIVSIREPLPLPAQVEDASDSECEDEFSDYIRNRRPRDGEWIEPVEAFQRL